MKKIQESLTPIVVLILLGIIVHDKFLKEEVAPVSTRDAAVVKLGKDYRLAITKSLVDPLKAVANSNATTTDEITKAQRASLEASLTASYTPVAKALETKFGKAEVNSGDVVGIKQFFADLVAGYEGK